MFYLRGGGEGQGDDCLLLHPASLHTVHKHPAVQYSTVQYSTVQYSKQLVYLPDLPDSSSLVNKQVMHYSET